MRLINSIAGMLAALTLVPLMVPSANASTTVYTTKKVIYTTHKVVTSNCRRPACHHVAYRHLSNQRVAYRTHTVYRTAYQPVETTSTVRTVTRTVAVTPTTTFVTMPASPIIERRMVVNTITPQTLVAPTSVRVISTEPGYVMEPTSVKVRKHGSEIRIKESAVPVSDWY